MRSDWGQTGESKFRLCPKAGRIGEESVNSSITDAIQMQMTFLPVLLQRFNLIFRPNSSPGARYSLSSSTHF